LRGDKIGLKITDVREGIFFVRLIKVGLPLGFVLLIGGSFELLFAQTPSTSEKTRIAVPGKSLNHLPFYFGKDKGFFRDEGIELELIRMAGTVGAAALQAGEVDYTAAANVAVRAAIRGAPLRSIIFIQTRSSFSLIGQPSMTPDKVNTIAVNGLGTASHYAALATMDKLGQGGRKIAYINVMNTIMGYTALTNKTADATTLTQPFTSMATISGYSYLGDAYHIPAVQGGLATTTRHLAQKERQTRAVLRAILRAMGNIASNREDVVDYIQKEFRLERNVAIESYDSMKRTFNPSGDIDDGELRQAVAQVKKEIGVTVDTPLDRMVDLSHLRKVQMELANEKLTGGK
jgi:ABC-type nitrate/sulfonate/bicarbonate transport system substrate-binding protein